MKKSKGASKTNLIFNVCRCAIKSLHMHRLCVSTCISVLTNTSGCEQVPGCAVPVWGNICRWNTLCVHPECPLQDCTSHRDTEPSHSQALLAKSQQRDKCHCINTYDPFCDLIFQSPNRVELIKLDLKK